MRRLALIAYKKLIYKIGSKLYAKGEKSTKYSETKKMWQNKFLLQKSVNSEGEKHAVGSKSSWPLPRVSSRFTTESVNDEVSCTVK